MLPPPLRESTRLSFLSFILLAMPHRLTSRFELPAEKEKTADFTIDTKDKQYGKQYANLYWLRLVVLRQRVEERASKRWSNLPGEFELLRTC